MATPPRALKTSRPPSVRGDGQGVLLPRGIKSAPRHWGSVCPQTSVPASEGTGFRSAAVALWISDTTVTRWHLFPACTLGLELPPPAMI